MPTWQLYPRDAQLQEEGMSIAVRPSVARKTDRLFFTGMALACALMLYLGFLPSFFHRSAELPPLTPLYQLHGVLFTAWIALFVVQATLVAGGRIDIHRALGVAGAVLAAIVSETIRANWRCGASTQAASTT